MRIDVLVEDAILAALSRHPVNVLTEETGWVDNGSALTLVMDPVDGSANAAAGSRCPRSPPPWPRTASSPRH
ncbi:hypothetical protein [Nonomuraea zeae]|uniref:Inositol-phosphate phosphatase n=2 Tax=Nonomuraea zeae TaxID=1642303 RepID=A0A5S4G2T4_9ACTN|nr:hypothetical protein [Nonomuraea zeae]TMR27266.1 hypothetical protein ETD85_39745 [Nonomuraea zeae]